MDQSLERRRQIGLKIRSESLFGRRIGGFGVAVDAFFADTKAILLCDPLPGLEFPKGFLKLRFELVVGGTELVYSLLRK